MNNMLNIEQHGQLIKERTAAEMIGVSVPTLRRWRLFGSGPIYRKLNGSVRYSLTDIQKFIDDGARISTGRRA